MVGFSDRPTRAGLVVMDTPSHDTVALTGMVTGGAQLCIATTGRGSPVGNALAPGHQRDRQSTHGRADG